MPNSPEQLTLHDRQLTLAECLPDDFSFLDRYQATVWEQIQWDNTPGGLIRGKRAKQYMLDGIIEEAHELVQDDDRVEPDYKRFGALLMLDALNGPAFGPGRVTATAVERHLKEFGDVAWYTANYLTLFGISYAASTKPGFLDWQLQRAASAATRGSDEHSDESERQLPAITLMSHIGRLQSAAADILNLRRDERGIAEENLAIAAGGYTLAVILTLANRYNTTYEAVLDRNIAKITKRITEGTVYDKSGGDDR